MSQEIMGGGDASEVCADDDKLMCVGGFHCSGGTLEEWLVSSQSLRCLILMFDVQCSEARER